MEKCSPKQTMKIVRQMGYSHADFFRLLPSTMGDHPYEIERLKVHCTLGDGTLTITVGPESERRLVLVVIPKTDITFEFDHVSDTERDAFLKYFDLRFMKGLG